MFKAVIVVAVLGITSVLAALDEEHTLSGGFETVRLRRASLPITYGNGPSSLNALEELDGSPLVREERRSRRRGKGRRGHKRGHRKYESQSDESEEVAIPWNPAVPEPVSDEYIDPPENIDIPLTWDQLDQELNAVADELDEFSPSANAEVGLPEFEPSYAPVEVGLPGSEPMNDDSGLGSFGQPQISDDSGFEVGQPQISGDPGFGGFDQPQISDDVGFGGFSQPQISDDVGFGGFGQPQISDDVGFGGFGQPQISDDVGFGGFGQPQISDDVGFGQPQQAVPASEPKIRDQYPPPATSDFGDDDPDGC